MDPIRKRARTATPSLTESEVRNASLDILSSSAASSSTNQHLLNEIDKLKTDLAKVQSQRKLDKIQAENNIKRLTRHTVTLEQDAKDANAMVEQIRFQSDGDMEDMAEKKTRAAKEADEWETRYWELREGQEEGGDTDHLKNELILANRKNEVLQDKVSSMEEEMHLLKQHLAATDTAKESLMQNDNDHDHEHTTPSKPHSHSHSHKLNDPFSPAPPAVLSELNRTRIKLADSERLNRQLSRKVDCLQLEADKMVEYRELSQNTAGKLTKLENEHKILRREREALRFVETRWVEFRKELINHNLGSEILQGSGGEDENIPPEIATLLRHFRTLEDKVQELESGASTLKVQYDMAQRRLGTLEIENKELNVEAKNWGEQKEMLKVKAIKAERELKIIQSQEKVWKREADSMRSLLDTYKAMEDNMAKMGSAPKVDHKSRSENDATIQGLQLSLSTAKEEVLLLNGQLDTVKSDAHTVRQELGSLKEEHGQVRSKFLKLRDALFQEREKAEKAEDRAAQAENLAGRGAFNQETTRVLHLQNNPLSNAVREKYEKEIEELMSELAELTAVQVHKGLVPMTVTKSSDPALDAEKFSKRLKDQFRNHIALFREGVHIITGYKIDMNVSDPETPRFTVRSVFAERETDQLDLLWRKDKHGKPRASMDILDTDLAQILSKEPAFEYMKKYKSLPAFTAAVCLQLFENQTMIG